MKSIYGFLHDSAEKYPDHAFVHHMDRVWTYYEVLNMTRYVSSMLLDHGIQKGDRVAIFCNNSIQYVTAFFGILESGAVTVPINPVKTAESVSYIISKCTPKLILTCDKTATQLDRIGDRLREPLPDIFNLDGLDTYIHPGNSSGGVDMANLAIEENDVAEILFSSGTTASPKGITLTHGNLMANTHAIIHYLELTFKDSVLMTLPFSYSYGNSILLTHTCAGASLVLEDSAAFPNKVLEGITKHGVSGFSTVGSYANILLKYIRDSDRNEKYFETLRYMTFAGEATSTDDICFIRDHFPYIKIYVMYGQTEASARLSYLDPELLDRKLGSIGKGLSNVELRVVNETGMDIRPGDVGEIIARGPNIMKGYWEDPASTDEAVKDGWLYTGDIATVDADGYIYIKGRKSDMIKYMGHRISPVEIEVVINRCNCIKECAVVESTLGKMPVIKAFIVLNDECTVDEVRNYSNSKLPAYMRPHVFEIINQIPKTESGKIKRNSLRGI